MAKIRDASYALVSESLIVIKVWVWLFKLLRRLHNSYSYISIKNSLTLQHSSYRILKFECTARPFNNMNPHFCAE